MAAELKLVHSKQHAYPRTDEDSSRCFRLWDSNERCDVPHRYYSDLIRAHNAALVLIRWEKVGASFEVYDIRTAKFHGTYKRRVDAVMFIKP